jgi:hypothetical protein
VAASQLSPDRIRYRGNRPILRRSVVLHRTPERSHRNSRCRRAPTDP